MGEKLPPIIRKGDTSSKPKLILVYKNGDRNFRGHQLTITQRRFRNFESLFTELTRVTNLAQGARFLFNEHTGTPITSLEQLQDGQSYVASSNTKLKRILYDQPPLDTYVKTTKSIEKKHENNKTKTTTTTTTEKFPSDVKARLITVVRNTAGGSHKCCSVLLNKRTAQTYNQVLDNITEIVGSGVGPVWKLYNANGRLVKGLTDLIAPDENVFVAVSFCLTFLSSYFPRDESI